MVTASVPILRVKRLKPLFERQHHLGTMSRRRAISRIERDAELARSKQIDRLQGRRE
jgi:hypothetical protein